MKILFYGAGVMGSLYAARLQDSGEEVSILARRQRLADIREVLHALFRGGVLNALDADQLTHRRVGGNETH